MYLTLGTTFSNHVSVSMRMCTCQNYCQLVRVVAGTDKRAITTAAHFFCSHSRSRKPQESGSGKARGGVGSECALQ